MKSEGELQHLECAFPSHSIFPIWYEMGVGSSSRIQQRPWMDGQERAASHTKREGKRSLKQLSRPKSFSFLSSTLQAINQASKQANRHHNAVHGQQYIPAAIIMQRLDLPGQGQRQGARAADTGRPTSQAPQHRPSTASLVGHLLQPSVVEFLDHSCWHPFVGLASTQPEVCSLPWYRTPVVNLLRQQHQPLPQPLPQTSQYHHDHHDHHEYGSTMFVGLGEPSPSPARNAGAALPHHAPNDSVFSPAATATHSADMDAATADAIAQDAPPAVSLAPDSLAEPLVADVKPSIVNNNTTTTDDVNVDQPLASNGLPALGAPIALDPSTTMDGIPMATDFPPMDPFPQPVAAEERLSAFARLRFDDGSYYMHTYQIVLGRDVAAAHKDMRRLAKVDQLRAKGEQRRAQELLHKKKQRRRNRTARSVRSETGGIVNAPIEMMPVEYQQRRQSIASHSLSSSSHRNGNNNGNANGNGNESSQEEPIEHAPQDMLMQAFPEAPAQLDSHVPEDPNDCPLVPIHPQHVTSRTGSKGPKGISRHHAKIFYDFDNGNFCLEVLGSNGLWHDDHFLAMGTVVGLDHGDSITIGAVNMSFFLPDIALTDEQRNRQESGSRPMSFSFENGHGELESDDEVGSSGSEDVSINPRHVYHYPVGSDFESEEDLMGEEEEYEDEDEPVPPRPTKQSLKLKIKAPPPPVPVKESKKDKKRKVREVTPDQPPVKKKKHMIKESYKEPKEVPKEKGKAPTKSPAKAPVKEPVVETPAKVKAEKPEPAKTVPSDSPPILRKPLAEELDGELEGLITEEMARQHNLPVTLIGHVIEKRKGPGRPPKDGIMSKRQRSQLIKQAKEIEKAKAAGIDPADLPAPTIKPKIARARKDSNAGEEEEIRESTEKGDGTNVSSEKKQVKPTKPPRTPSPEMRIEDYTEEQLQRPSANYVVLIHEAISSSSTGQMNLQQIYNYIERKYPWYKFKTTTSGWQSSVRHNLGQHDAFVKGDKEGKGFNWRINPEVSIEKERRKRQVSPPVNHAPRQQYYPPPTGYPPYGQPGHPYYPGMPPHGVPPNSAPRPPPSVEAQPRLPPSLARSAAASATPTSQGAPAPSPYASPWAGGATTGSAAAQNSARPTYPPPNAQQPATSSTAASQYGVLYPTSAPQSYSGPYGSQYATSGVSPYGAAPGRPYTPYPPTGQQSGASATPPIQPAQTQPPNETSAVPHPSGRYPLSTNPDLIRQLEAFRQVYLQTRIEPGEDKKVDNAIRAYVDSTVPLATLTDAEKALLRSIQSIEGLQKYRGDVAPAKQENAPANAPTGSTVAAGTAAAIAADAAANVAPKPSTPVEQAQQSAPAPTPAAPAPGPPSEPHKFTPNMMGLPSTVPPGPAPVPALVQTQRPSVEPLTPVPGSPAVQNGTPIKRSFAELSTEATGNAEETKKVESTPAAEVAKEATTVETTAATDANKTVKEE